MAKDVFLLGGITAEDFSYLKAMYEALAASTDGLKLWPEPPPVGLQERLDNAPIYAKSNAENEVAAKQARIVELEAELATKTVRG